MAVLVGINIAVIFSEGWTVKKRPLGYSYTALQKFYHSIECREGICNTLLSNESTDNLASPIYWVSSAMAYLFGPTPPVFRLTSVLFLCCIFILSFHMDSTEKFINKLLTAVTVTATPALLFSGRYLEDYAFGTLLLVAAAFCAVRSIEKSKSVFSLMFLALPIITYLSMLTSTDFILWMTGWGGLFLGKLYYLTKQDRPVYKTFIFEAIGGAASVFCLLLIMKLRASYPATGFFEYYRGEMTNQKYDFISWFDHLITYPKVILLSSVGFVYCAVACFGFSKKHRGRHNVLYLMMILIPLIVLTLINKKNHYYIWMFVPAIAFLAAGSVSGMPVLLKRGWILLCLILAAMHLIGESAPLERYLDELVIENKHMGVGAELSLSGTEFDFKSSMPVAKKVLEMVNQCRLPKNAPVIVRTNRNPRPFVIYYCMLYQNQDHSYWFFDDMPTSIMKNAAIIEIRFGEGKEKRFSGFVDLTGDAPYNFFRHQLVASVSNIKLFCPVQ